MRDHVARTSSSPAALAAAYGERGASGASSRCVPRLNMPVDLIGGNLDEARSAGSDATRLQQHVDADHTSRQECLRVEDGPIHMQFGREIDDRIGRLDERSDDRRVGDIAAHEGQSRGHLRVIPNRCKVGLVARVGQLVQHGDPRPVAPTQHVADVARANEPGATGDQQLVELPDRAAAVTPQDRDGQAVGRLTGGASRPAASSAAASSAARNERGTVPASVQWPS